LREHRRYERVEARIKCWCEGENVTFYARVGNLSEGGLFLTTLTPLALGMRAQVRLQTEENEELATSATVVWSQEDESQGPPGMGLAFDALDEQTQERIRSLVARERSRLASRPPATIEQTPA
jgi:uncharacterized protein (TIGR02266 family)